MTQTTIVIPLYAGVTHLDFTGPHQFLSRLPEATVIAATIGGHAIAADGLTFSDLSDLEKVETCDVLCVPGGHGCVEAMNDARYMAQIERLSLSSSYVTSVCSGSLILGAAGLLRGKRATCHWAFLDLLPLFGAVPDASRVVRDGTTITGGGVTAGIDFALTLIAELSSQSVAEAIQLSLEYAPEPPFSAGRPDLAPVEVYDRVSSRLAGHTPAYRAAVERAAANLGY